MKSPGGWIFKRRRLDSIFESNIRYQLPILYRIFSCYCHVVGYVSPIYLPSEIRIFRLVRRITQILSLTDTVRLEIDGKVIFVDLLDPRFIQVVNEVQGSDTQILEDLLGKGDTFIDVGANHGSFAIVASQLVGPDGHVCAFEPQPRLAALIRQSLQEGTSSHEVHQIALGDTPGEVSLYVPNDTSGSAGVYEEHSATHEYREIDVSMRTFDEVVDWERYPGRVVLKLDVEGSEIPFLEGAREMIRKRRPVLILEIHPGTLKASRHTGEELKRTLMRHGYETYSSFEAPQMKRPLSDLPISEQRDVICR